MPGSTINSVLKLPDYSIPRLPIFLRNKSQVLRQRAGNRDFKQRSWAIRIDRQGPIGGKEHRNLGLCADGCCRHKWRSTDVGHERVRVFPETNSQRKCQVVAEESCAVLKITRPNQRCRGWVRYSLVAAGKLHDHAFRGVALKR